MEHDLFRRIKEMNPMKCYHNQYWLHSAQRAKNIAYLYAESLFHDGWI